MNEKFWKSLLVLYNIQEFPWKEARETSSRESDLFRDLKPEQPKYAEGVISTQYNFQFRWTREVPEK